MTTSRRNRIVLTNDIVSGEAATRLLDIFPVLPAIQEADDDVVDVGDLITQLLNRYDQLAATQPCVCSQCSRAYRADLLVPDRVWEVIRPDGSEAGGGLLCPTCMMERLVERCGWTVGFAYSRREGNEVTAGIANEPGDDLFWVTDDRGWMAVAFSDENLTYRIDYNATHHSLPWGIKAYDGRPLGRRLELRDARIVAQEDYDAARAFVRSKMIKE